MTNDIKHIHSYYTPNDLYNKIKKGLETLEIDLDKVTPNDLQPVDEFHIRGDKATNELIALANFSDDMHILDVGCGIGGSTRRLSHETGCRVTGIDLSDEYIDAAKRLTELLNMQDKVDFEACSALELPYDDNSFDGVWSLQMNMNIEDKLGWVKEIYRVLKPGQRAILYEVCGNKNPDLEFPVPWAQDGTMSFLVPPAEFREIIEQAGFEIQDWNDKTDLAKIAFSGATKPEGKPKLPVLGVYMLVGEDISMKAYNLHRNLENESVSLIETALKKPE